MRDRRPPERGPSLMRLAAIAAGAFACILVIALLTRGGPPPHNAYGYLRQYTEVPAAVVPQRSTQSPIVFDGTTFVAQRPQQPRTRPPAPHTTKPSDDAEEATSAPLCHRGRAVTIVGNRPVGTYLCDYFPEAVHVAGGCKLACPADPLPPGESVPSRPRGAVVQCTIKRKATPAELGTADAVVNHHGPVPKQRHPLQMAVYYTGESNASEPKKSTEAYWGSYTHVVSFHSDRALHFTWTHRFRQHFEAIESSGGEVPLLDGDEGPVLPWKERIDGVAIFVSRCNKGDRERIIAAIGKVYPVFSFGKCGRTHRVEKEHPRCLDATSRYREKLCVYRRYKYVLALDNTQERDYVTEKVYHALITGAVPLYDGAPNVADFLPRPSSIVALGDFTTGTVSRREVRTNPAAIDFKRLGQFLRSADGDAILGWMRDPVSWGDPFRRHLLHPEPTCDLCRIAARRRCQRSEPPAE